MTLKFLWIFSLCYFLLLSVLQAGLSTYTVVSGDTLWDLSYKNYGDPYLWPSLWEVNKSSVTNPHLIYVGQVLLIPSKDEIKNIKVTATPAPPVSVREVVKKENSEISFQTEPSVETQKPEHPVKAPVVEDRSEVSKEMLQPEPTPPRVVSEVVAGVGGVEARLVDEKFVPDGVITSLKEYKILVAQGDVVYIDIISDKVLKSDLLTIYRKTKKIKSKTFKGYELVRIGVVRIIDEPTQKTAPAEILFCNDPVKIGDWVIKVR